MKYLLVLAVLISTAVLVDAAPVTTRQGDLGCPSTDDVGSPLTLVEPSGDDNGLACDYETAGACRYFADGTFSSGGSDCPDALVAGGEQVGANVVAAAAAAAPPPPPPPPPPPSTTTTTSSTSEYTSSSYYGYGSGSWDKSGYNDCVSKCMAQYGGGSGGTYQGGSSGEVAGSAGSVGEGATHTVVVAPSQGVLRYVPPFIDANIGDTIMFKWGANNHTVTKGSALQPCNKTADALFASGQQNKDFTFTQRVNDTSATYFYCATPGHCQKGMFGIINPNKAKGSNTSAGVWMNNTYGSSSSNSSSSANSTVSSNMTSYMSYTTTMTQNNAVAATWGSDFDMESVPDWARESMAGNIMYMRNLIATNPDMIDSNGKVAVTDAPLALPNDIGAVNNAASTDSSSTTSTSSAAPSATSTEVAGAAPQNQPNGASVLAASKFSIGAGIILATTFLL